MYFISLKVLRFYLIFYSYLNMLNNVKTLLIQLIKYLVTITLRGSSYSTVFFNQFFI